MKYRLIEIIDNHPAVNKVDSLDPNQELKANYGSKLDFEMATNSLYSYGKLMLSVNNECIFEFEFGIKIEIEEIEKYIQISNGKAQITGINEEFFNSIMNETYSTGRGLAIKYVPGDFCCRVFQLNRGDHLFTKMRQKTQK